MKVQELSTDAELDLARPLMIELRVRLRDADGAGFRAQVRRQQVEGYRLFGGFVGGARLVALCGVRRSHTLSRGEHLFVDDLVTAEGGRGRGFGSALLRAVAERAQAEGVELCCLDSRDTARGFYEKLGFEVQTSLPCRIPIARLVKQEKHAGKTPPPRSGRRRDQ